MAGPCMLSDGVVFLREITTADIPLLFEWRNETETRPLFRDERPLQFDKHTGFIESHLANPHRDYWWIIEAGNEPVGTIALYGFTADRRACEFGRFIIGRSHRGAGYGHRALRLAMSVARSLGVERLSCEVLSSNDLAMGLYSSLGFAVKGVEVTGRRSFVLMENDLNRP